MSPAGEIQKKSYKKVSDKYNTGRLIGKSAFGKAYKCWLRKDIA